MLPDPLGQPHHAQGLARALRVPDDAALARTNPLLGRLDPEVLVRTARLLNAGVEDHEVVDNLEKAFLRTQLR